MPRLILDEAKLSLVYVPRLLPHREREVEEVKRWVRFFVERERPANTFLHVVGPLASGKTALVKRACGGFKGASFVYVNVDCLRSPRFILSEVLKALGLRVEPTGKDPAELLLRLLELMKGERLIVCFDDVDGYALSGRDTGFLNMLVKGCEMEPEAKLCLILVYRDPKWLERLNGSVKQRLTGWTVKLEAYRRKQVEDILAYRAEEAFAPGALSGELLSFMAALSSSEPGGVRYGLELMLGAGRIAEATGSDRVKAEHVRLAHAQMIGRGGLWDELSVHDLVLLEAVAREVKERVFVSLEEVHRTYLAVCEGRGVEPEESLEEGARRLVNHGYLMLEGGRYGLEYPSEYVVKWVEARLNRLAHSGQAYREGPPPL